MQTVERTTASGLDAARALSQLLADGVDAMAHLDAESLELLQVRARQLHGELDEEAQARLPDNSRQELASRHSVFGEVLRSTGEQLNLLRRMNGRGKASPWDR
jgi:ABC-type phosphate transport system auxiliary subunit